MGFGLGLGLDLDLAAPDAHARGAEVRERARREERVYYECAAVRGDVYAHQSREHQVGKRGVKVMVAAIAVAVPPLVHQPPSQPVAIVAVKGLVSKYAVK